MTKASTVLKKSNFYKSFPFNRIWKQIDLDIEKVKVILGSSFEHTW